MAQASECLFCKIVREELPAEVVHSSDNVVAFRDANPQAPTHILLIPKEHIESVASLGERQGKLLAEIVQTATHLAEAEKIDRSGWRLVTNVGADAGQSVLHLHFHLLGGRPFRWPPG
jgi:histidine triad (HIT) family protein